MQNAYTIIFRVSYLKVPAGVYLLSTYTVS